VTICQLPLSWLQRQPGELGVGAGMFMRARAQVVATDDPESRQSYIRLPDADGNVIDVDPGNQS